MSDVGVKLTFSDPDACVAFAREIEGVRDDEREFRIALFDPKLNFDSDTLVLVLKTVGSAAGAVGSLLTLSQVLLKKLKKSAVKIEIGDKKVELSDQASADDIKLLCEVLSRSGR